MGVFDDKKFDELDWISQATEPIDSKMNEVLGLIPESLTFDFNLYVEMINGAYGLDLSLDRAIAHCLSTYSPDVHLTCDQKNVLRDMFEFQINPDESIILDFENRTLTGEIKLIKLASTMDEKVLESLLGKEGIMAVSAMYCGPAGLSRANEIMDLLGQCEEGMRTRSDRRKRRIIQTRLTNLFKINEWNIRDTELANKVGFWIRDYVSSGNLAAFSNFCRLKVMTHKNQPIYSMEEVV